MEDRKELVVGGYRFDRLSDASEAALEIEKATYFEQRISGRSPENMLAIYDKVLDERIFVTPVGWEYLKFLQARLKEEGIDAVLKKVCGIDPNGELGLMIKEKIEKIKEWGWLKNE